MSCLRSSIASLPADEARREALGNRRREQRATQITLARDQAQRLGKRSEGTTSTGALRRERV